MSDDNKEAVALNDELGQLTAHARLLASAIDPLLRKSPATDHLTVAAASRTLCLQADEIDRLRAELDARDKRIDALIARNQQREAYLRRYIR